MLRGMRSKNSEMPIPTRAAPRPPGQIGQSMGWSSSDPFGPLATPQPIQKKKPPPRPPPPRFRKDQLNDKSKKPARPTELLGNLFGLKSSTKQPQINNVYSGVPSRPQQPSVGMHTMNLLDTGVSLIDLSPPGSPTFTTRSSSDGVSVDSFGSDGNSNPSVFTSSGNTSQTESAFEDDFDFFGSLNKQRADPWKTTADPFSPVSSTMSNGLTSMTNGMTAMTNGIKQVGDANFFAFNNEPAKSGFPANTSAPTMPTIIRARPPKPPAPKFLKTSLAPTVTNFAASASVNTMSAVNGMSSRATTAFSSSSWCDNFEETCERINPSPPMPTIPPPAPPVEYLAELGEPVDKSKPHGIALYDFPATQPDDLPLKLGDVVILKKQINDEWLEGQVANRTGMFPANFIDVIVPLPVSETSNVVNALYSFPGETWDDLPFEEGAKINVLSKISDEWLYGECQGKKGQFPSNYVDRVPGNLPNHSSCS